VVQEVEDDRHHLSRVLTNAHTSLYTGLKYRTKVLKKYIGRREVYVGTIEKPIFLMHNARTAIFVHSKHIIIERTVPERRQKKTPIQYDTASF